MGQPSCLLNIGNTIKHLIILQEYILSTTLEFLRPYIREEQNSWRQNIVTGLEMIMQPIFWTYMQETQV